MNIILGMSGGIDSSVSAYILKKKGYNVVGIFMLNWDEKNLSYCTFIKDVIDTKKICNFLNIDFYIINFAFDYWKDVFVYFLNEYKLGKTPNPDIVCNSKIKFNIFLEYGKYLGANFIATGHYAKINFIKNSYFLCCSFDMHKDQTYFLYNLSQFQLKYVIFPLYKYSKNFIRNLGFSVGLYNSVKKDSSGICFVGKLDFCFFLKKYLSICYGPIVDFFENQVGIHEGIMFYTYGQKKNLSNNFTLSKYVYNKIINENFLVVSNKLKICLKISCLVQNVNFINFFLFLNINCFAKIRNFFIKKNCLLKKFTGNVFFVNFYLFNDILCPGQSIVFYKNNICLGGGIVTNIELYKV